MTALTTIQAPGVVILGDDIDTDQIMPSRFLSVTSFAGLERHVFADARVEAARAGRLHPMDQVTAQQSRILLVNKNFGCGSSREHAPQALRRSGIIAILGESFGEIFAGNAVALGLPCVQLESDVMRSIQRHVNVYPTAQIALSLREATVAIEGLGEFQITISEGRRQQFLSGTWDPVTMLLTAGDTIEVTLSRLPQAAYLGHDVTQPRTKA